MVKTDFMAIARIVGDSSYCDSRRVGAVAVLDGRIICTGFNGTPPGEPNCCEDENGDTLPNVIHAEINMIRFAEKNDIDLYGTEVYVTTAPCPNCALELFAEGVSKVYWREKFRDNEGIRRLKSHGVATEKC